jgi:hypothetical protein
MPNDYDRTVVNDFIGRAFVTNGSLGLLQSQVFR